MTTDTSQHLVERFVKEWLNERRRSSLEELCDPGIAFHWGALGEGTGVDGLFAQEERVRAAFPDLRVEPGLIVADGRFVVNRSIVTGTQQGPWFGLKPTARRATWTAVEIYRIADGRLAEQWLNEDWTLVLQQLGALPLSEGVA